MPRREAKSSKSRPPANGNSAKPRNGSARKRPRALGQTQVLKHSTIEQSVLERLNRPFPLLSDSVPQAPPVPSLAFPAPSTRIAVTQLAHPLPAWLPTSAALLAGLAGAYQWNGAYTLFTANIDPLPATATMACVIAMFLVAAGMRLQSRVPIDKWVSGPPLVVVAVVSLAAGFLSLLSVAASGPLFALYHRLLGGFFWTNLSLAGLDWLLVATLLAFPCVAMGTLLSRLVALVHDRGESDTCPALLPAALMGGLLIGLAVDGLGPCLSAERQVILGSLPLFLLAFGAMAWSQRCPQQRRNLLRVAPPAPASVGLGRPAVLFAASALAAMCMSWLSLAARDRNEFNVWSAMLLAGMVIGYLVAHACCICGLRPLLRSTALWMCGVGAAAAAMLAAWSPQHPWSLAFQLLAVALPGGGVLYTCLLDQRSRTITTFMVLLVGAALGVAAARWWGFPQLGPMGTLAGGSLMLLAAGGLLEIHSDIRSGWSKSLRLAVVFASLAAAIPLMPAGTRTWTRRHEQRTASASSSLCPSRELLAILQDVRTACLIGVDPRTANNLLDSLPPGRLTQAEVLPLSSWWPREWQTHGTEVINVVSMPAARAFRLSHGRYQLVYQFMHAGSDDPAAYCSVEWLDRLNQHLSPGGILIVDLPIGGLNSQAVVDLAATFQHINPTQSSWFVVEGEHPRLILQSGRPPEVNGRPLAPGLPLETLLQPGNLQPRVYSLQQRSAHGHQATRRLGPSSNEYAQNLTALLDWLTGRADGVLPVAEPATSMR